MPERKKSSRLRQKRQASSSKGNTKQELKQPPSAKPVLNLNNIIEVTQQYETNRFNTESIEEASAFIKKNKRTWWQKSFQCFKLCFQCLWAKPEFSIVVKEQQILKTIEKLRTEKIKTKPFLPPLESNKKTLVLDVDQTLVYSSQNELEKYDFCFTMPFKKTQIKVYTKNRFGLESFLFQMSKLYEIVIYTTNIRDYVDIVLQNIDKKKRISHVLYKDKCLNLNKVHYLKSLIALGRDPDKVVFLDHNIASGILQPKNYLALKPFGGEKHDRQLVKLIPFLRELAEQNSVIPVSKNYEQYFNREIRLKFNNLQQTNMQDKDEKENRSPESRKSCESSAMKKRRKEHRRDPSQLPLNKKQQQNENEGKGDEKQVQETQSSLRVRDSNAQQAF